MASFSPLRLIRGSIFVLTSLLATTLCVPVIGNSLVQDFKNTSDFWKEHKCVFPDILTYDNPIVDVFSLGQAQGIKGTLKPCSIASHDQSEKNVYFHEQLCSMFFKVSKLLCGGNLSTFEKQKLEPKSLAELTDQPEWKVCNAVNNLTVKGFFSFMTSDTERCESQCVANVELAPVCRLLIAATVKYEEGLQLEKAKLAGTGSGRVNSQPPAGAGTDSPQPPTGTGAGTGAGTGTDGQQPPPGTGVDVKQPSAGAGTDSPQPPTGTGTGAGTGTDGQQPPPGTGVDVKQPSAGAGTDSPQPPTGTGAGTGTDGQQPPPGTGVDVKQPSAGAGTDSAHPPAEGSSAGAGAGTQQPLAGAGTGTGAEQPPANVGTGVEQPPANVSTGAEQPLTGTGKDAEQPSTGTGTPQPLAGAGTGPGAEQPTANVSKGAEQPPAGAATGAEQPPNATGAVQTPAGTDTGAVLTPSDTERGPALSPAGKGTGAAMPPTQPSKSSESTPLRNLKEPKSDSTGFLPEKTQIPHRDEGSATTTSKPKDGLVKMHPLAPGQGDSRFDPIGNGNGKLQPQGQDGTNEGLSWTTTTTTTTRPSASLPDFHQDQDEKDHYGLGTVDVNKGNDGFEKSWEKPWEKPDSQDSPRQPEIPRPPLNQRQNNVRVHTFDDEEESPTGHFMAYFVTAAVLCVVGYVVYHNKNKILAFALEGRRDMAARRRAPSGNGASGSTAQYHKLEPTVEEVMPSLEKTTTSKNYIY